MPVISDEPNEFEERATLTQRRQMGGASKLNRAKLEPLKATASDGDKEGGTSGRIVVWVVAVITVAAAAYFGIKSFVNKPATENTTPTVAPTVEPTMSIAEQIMDDTVKADSQASNVKVNSAFVTTNQTVGKASTTAEYTLTDLTVQKYETFTRFNFTLSGAMTTPTVTGVVDPFPVITATYDKTNNTITLLFTQMASNVSAFTTADSVAIGTPNIDSLTHDISVPADQEKYVIELSSQAGYVMQVVTASNLLIVDVKDIKPVATTVVPTTVAVTGTVTVSPTVRPTVTVAVTPASGSSTEFSKTSQSITSTLSTNTFQLISGYNYGVTHFTSSNGETYNNMLTYQKQFSGTVYPNVDAQLDGTTLTINIHNYATANMAKQTVTFPTNPSVTHLEAQVTNHVLTYTLYEVTAKDYRIIFDMDHQVMLLQVRN